MKTTEKLLLGQAVLLAGGTVVAWFNLINQFANFHSLYGTFFRFRDCAVPNPLATACFYGSLAFIAALVWAMAMFMKPNPTGERRLRNFLIFCVIFAGSVVSYEFAGYYNLLGGNAIPVTCSPGVFPLLTPCFFGLCFFLGAYLVSRIAVRRIG